MIAGIHIPIWMRCRTLLSWLRASATLEYCIEKPSEVEDALREMFGRKDQLVFMDFITDQTENVYPMIAAGAGHNEMHLQPFE